MRWFEQALEDLVGLAFALKDPDVGFLRYENLEQWPQKEFDIIEGGIGNSSFGFSQAIQTLRNMMHSKPEPVVIRDKDEPDERFLEIDRCELFYVDDEDPHFDRLDPEVIKEMKRRLAKQRVNLFGM